MPLYEYVCANCRHTCEYLQKVNDQPVQHCPQCGQDQLKRQVSSSHFQLKGSGWYATDSKKEDTKKEDSTKETKE